jgi:hypothetical protein
MVGSDEPQGDEAAAEAVFMDRTARGTHAN